MIKNISLRVGLRDTCKNLCTMEHTCLSVNMGPPKNDKVLCQMSVSDHMRHPGDMKQNKGFTYRGTKVRNGPLCKTKLRRDLTKSWIKVIQNI